MCLYISMYRVAKFTIDRGSKEYFITTIVLKSPIPGVIIWTILLTMSCLILQEYQIS